MYFECKANPRKWASVSGTFGGEALQSGVANWKASILKHEVPRKCLAYNQYYLYCSTNR